MSFYFFTNFNTSFILGNTFSIDGIHLSTQGYGIVANEFIDKINSAFGASIPKIRISTLPGSIPLEKIGQISKSTFKLRICSWKDILY